MKIFSSLIAFVMMFACLSVAYADVPLPPRPRNVQSDFITADVDDAGKLHLKFEFPYECKYEYQLIHHRIIEHWERDGDTSRLKSTEVKRNEVHSGKGSYKTGDVVEEIVNLNMLDNGRNFFLLNVKVSNIKEQTRFGTKKRLDNQEFTKTILIGYSRMQEKFYELGVYDGDQTRS